MRYLIFCFLLALSGNFVFGQGSRDTIGGEVSYKTPQSIYVRFQSTKDISIGDTLFTLREGKIQPALIVKYISSTSCVGSPMTDQTIETGTRIIARVKAKIKAQPAEIVHEVSPEARDIRDTPEDENPVTAKEKQPREKESLKGRISAASYIDFSDQPEHDKQRMRYTMSVNARRIGNTGFSAESYISFRHTLNEWQEVKDHFKKAFKIYSLALEYGVNERTRLWLGRKINLNISNIGAIDGLQAEKRWNRTFAGVFAGSRPDHTDYDFNFNLLQFGAYAGNTIESKNGTIQNTLAIAEQRNHGVTDRRFAYLQHINSVIKRVNIFTSFEFDLYKMENDQAKNTLDISSIYFSLRYRASDKLSLFGSYDARRNIIYYETYKNFIDQLLEDEMRQGLRFSFNYRPLKKITVGSSAGYRFQKNNPYPSKNLYSYLTVSRIPGLDVSTTLSAVFIQSAYLEGIIYGIRASRDFFKGKLFGEAQYRLVKYKYSNVENPLKQSIAGANLSWRVTKKLSFSANYEGEILHNQLTNRIYTNIIQRL